MPALPNDLAIVVVRDGRIADLNPTAEHLLGGPREKLVGTEASRLGLPRVRGVFEATSMQLPDGRNVSVEAAGAEVRLDGQPATVLMLRDLTEREASVVIRRKNRELEALNAVTASAVRNAPVAEILAEAVAKIQAVLGGDSCAVNLATDDRRWLDTVAATGMSDETRAKAHHIQAGLVWRVFQEGKALLENNVATRPDANPGLQANAEQVRATVIAPILSRSGTLGTLSVCSYGTRRFASEDVSLLGALAAQLGAVIENARLIDDLRTQKEVSEILLAAATAFGRARGLDELSESLMDAVAWASGTKLAALILYDADRDVAWIAASTGIPQEHRHLVIGKEWGPHAPVFERLKESRETWMMDEATLKRSADAATWEAFKPKRVAMVPMFSQAGLLGCFSVNFDHLPHGPDARTLAILEGLAGLCSSALQNLKLWSVAERRAQLSSALLSFGQELASALDPDRILMRAVSQARELLRSDSAAVCLASEEGFRVEAEEGTLSPMTGKVKDLSRVFGGRLFTETRPVVVTDFEAPDVPAEDRELARAWGARSCVAVAMRARDRMIGVLHVHDAVARQHAAEDVTALSTLATWTAITLENAHLLQDLRISNDEIREAQAQVVRSESLAAIGRLSAAIAHEIRNPLSGISAAAQALLRASRTESSGNLQLLGIIDKESKRLNRIITDFLQFARPRMPAYRRVTVPALLESTLSLMEGDLGGRVSVSKEFAKDLPGIQADGDQIKQVLINILLNAVQAMPDGGRIEVRAQPAELPSGAAVEISIADTGPGIAAADLARVFEPFYSTKKDGTGLGLAIAHQIVQAHSGAITAHAAPARGAMFRIVLPVLPAGAPAPAAKSP